MGGTKKGKYEPRRKIGPKLPKKKKRNNVTIYGVGEERSQDQSQKTPKQGIEKKEERKKHSGSKHRKLPEETTNLRRLRSRRRYVGKGRSHQVSKM